MGQIPLRASEPRFQAHQKEIDRLQHDLNTKITDTNFSIQTPPCPSDFYVYGKLGQGAFGYVLEVEHKASGKLYALKVLDRVSVFQFCHRNKRRAHIRERTIHMATNFAFILQLVWHFERKGQMFFVIEHAPFGTIRDVVPLATEVQAQFVAGQLVLAVEYLHKNNVLHRDIKRENVFVGRDGYVRLGDFGLSKVLKPGERTYSVCGTPTHLAPEVAMEPRPGYSYGVDWFSLGACLFEFIHGDAAAERWRNIPWSRLLDVVRECTMYDLNILFPPLGISPRTYMFLKGLLEREVEQRLGVVYGGVETLKNHLWLSKFDYATLYAKRYRSPLFSAKVRYRILDPYWRESSQISPLVKQMFPPRPDETVYDFQTCYQLPCC